MQAALLGTHASSRCVALQSLGTTHISDSALQVYVADGRPGQYGCIQSEDPHGQGAGAGTGTGTGTGSSSRSELTLRRSQLTYSADEGIVHDIGMVGVLARCRCTMVRC